MYFGSTSKYLYIHIAVLGDMMAILYYLTLFEKFISLFFWFVCQNIVKVIIKIRYILWGIGVFERCIWEWSSSPYVTIGHLTPLLHTCWRLEESQLLNAVFVYICTYVCFVTFLLPPEGPVFNFVCNYKTRTARDSSL